MIKLIKKAWNRNTFGLAAITAGAPILCFIYMLYDYITAGYIKIEVPLIFGGAFLAIWITFIVYEKFKRS